MQVQLFWFPQYLHQNILWKELKKLYGRPFADSVVEMQLTGDIYINDMHGIGAGKPYCFNYSTYDILTKGLPMVKKVKCEPPKYLYSFKSQLEQFVTIASNSTLGATGTADMLIMMAYYVKNMLNTLSDAHFTFANEEAVWKYVRENLVSFVYTINQPMRGNQSPFTNLSVYDDNFLDKLCADYIFPDGSTPDKEIVKKLQNIYLDIMNEELQRTPLTFPVTTACFSIDKDNNIQDEAFLHNIAQKNLQWGFINMYAGSSSTLSSCCFDGSQKVFYMEDPEDGAWRIESLSRLYELYHDAVLFTMGAHGEKSMCKVIRIAGQPIYKLYLEGIKEPIPTSETHLNPVVGYGLVPSYKLAPGDKLISRGNDGEGAEVAITSISIEPAPEYVYCLEMITVPQEEALFTLPNGIITHNCRLRSEQQSEYFNSFGSGSSKIGSLGVCTINFPRLAIQYPLEEDFMEKLEEMVGVCAKVNNAKRHIVQKRINNGNEPLYKYEFSVLPRRITIKPHQTIKVGTGIAAAIPPGYFGAIFARSGLATKQGLRPANCVGVVDEDYRGEFIVALHNDTDKPQTIMHGDRIAQLVLLPYMRAQVREVDELDETERGTGGFGSTGA